MSAQVHMSLRYIITVKDEDMEKLRTNSHVNPSHWLVITQAERGTYLDSGWHGQEIRAGIHMADTLAQYLKVFFLENDLKVMDSPKKFK